MPKHTPEPWEVRGPDGTGWQIYAHVPSLDRAVVIEQVPIRPTVSISDDGKVYVCLSYEDWRQFPSDDWLEMQAANAQRIVACVNACKGINPETVPELLKALKNVTLQSNWKDKLAAVLKKDFDCLEASDQDVEEVLKKYGTDEGGE